MPTYAEAELGPPDRYNQILLENIRPPNWQNPAPAGRYNMVVVGTGSAGLVTAAGVAGLGGRVALIERHLFGGDCLNFGCVPSKTLIAAARAAADVRRAGQYGIRATGVTVDFGAVMQRLRQIRSRISRHDAAKKFSDMGVDVFFGQGRFTSPDSLQVGGQTLKFSRACIATGARAVQPQIPGLAEAGYYTNETIFSLTELPRRLAVLGSGPLGCELAQAFARLGSQVTLIERSGRFLGKEDPDAAVIVARSFERDGIRCIFNTRIHHVCPGETGKQLFIDNDGDQSTIEVDAILVGYGRIANVEDMGLEAAGVKYDKHKGVEVDDRLRTSNPRIYAAGDVCLKYKFTHTADATARIVIQNALFWGRKKFSTLAIPWCTYTDPEIAHVGLYEKEARERGIDTDTYTQSFSENDRALTEGQEEGFVRIIVRKGSDRIIGATIVGRQAGELISELTVAITGKIGLGSLASIIHPYPTLAEAIKAVADKYNRTRLTSHLQTLLRYILAWKR